MFPARISSAVIIISCGMLWKMVNNDVMCAHVSNAFHKKILQVVVFFFCLWLRRKTSKCTLGKDLQLTIKESFLFYFFPPSVYCCWLKLKETQLTRVRDRATLPAIPFTTLRRSLSILKWIHSDAPHFSNWNLWDRLLSSRKSV